MVDQPPNSTVNSSTISISEIDLATEHGLAAPIAVQSTSYSIAGDSRIVKRDKYYYLLMAEARDSGQQGCVSRSELGPFGPWEPAPQSPLWHDVTDGEVQNTSHPDVFEDAQGQWWAVLSGTRWRKIDDKWTKSVLGKSSVSS